MLLEHLDGDIRMVITCDDGQRIDVLVERANIFQTYNFFLGSGQMRSRVPYIEDSEHNTLQTDMATLLRTLQCITQSDQAYIKMGREIEGGYTDDGNNIHIDDKLGEEAV